MVAQNCKKQTTLTSTSVEAVDAFGLHSGLGCIHCEGRALRWRPLLPLDWVPLPDTALCVELLAMSRPNSRRGTLR